MSLVLFYCVFGRGLAWAVCTLCACMRKGVCKPNPGVREGVWGLVLFGNGMVYTLG